MPTVDLFSWEVANPSNAEDALPQPYRLINQVLNQTIIHQLQLSMHYIEQKKGNPNYEGRVRQYLAQSLIQIDHQICCLSAESKYQNYLVAGDRKGNLLIVDVAKKSLFCKKQVSPGKRVTYISEATLSDGSTFVTVCAVISNNSNLIRILRLKHNDPKTVLAFEVEVTNNDQETARFPYQCKLEDDARLLIVKTFDGTLIAFCLPELRIDQNKVKAQQNINESLSSASNSIKKFITYPFECCLLQSNCSRITQKLFELKFEGHQKPLNFKDVLSKLKNKSKTSEQQIPEQNSNNKKESKKDSKKVQVQAAQILKQAQKQILHNQKQNKREVTIWNSNDVSESYQIPIFQPFYYLLYQSVECPHKKAFEKGNNLRMASKIIYGWTNTRNVYSTSLLSEGSPKYQNAPYYQQFLQSQALFKEQQICKLQKSYFNSFSVTAIEQKSSHVCCKTVYPITSSSISVPDFRILALGLEDGTLSIYSSETLILEQNTEKHSAKVTKIAFFQNCWKIISGSSKGQIHITNLVEQKLEMKKTQVFQSKEENPIGDIKVNQQIGLAFVIDIAGNVRVYDLWRNQKISRITPCNKFAITEGKGKKWMAAKLQISFTSLYTNKDFSVLLSIDWPNVPSSKAVKTPQQALDQAAELKKNPWKSSQIYLHVIRNFQFLLQNFDGLQSVYKKGHQKSKILNLFTNLEFAQLYDRNFDIPDFGRIININEQHSSMKSNLITESKFNASNSRLSKRSLLKSKSKQKSVSGTFSAKQTPIEQRGNANLTTEALHPQKFLFQRRKVINTSSNLPTSNQKLIEQLRQQHKKKERRANILQQELNKISGGI